MNRAGLSLAEHMEELRRRIITCLLVVLISSLVASVFTPRILEILKRPAGEYLPALAFFSPTEAIWAYLKIAMVSGLIASFPFILWETWRFVSPALEAKERRIISSFFWLVVVLSAVGFAFAYYVLLPFALKFLLTFASKQLVAVISVDKYLSFVLALLLGCGLVFEMPVVVLILARLKLISSNVMRSKRKIAILLMFIISAIITPTPDVFNMTLMALPMFFLYEISIVIAIFTEKRKKKDV